MKRENYILNGYRGSHKIKSNWDEYKNSLIENIIPLLLNCGLKIDKIFKKWATVSHDPKIDVSKLIPNLVWNKVLLDTLCQEYDEKLILKTLNVGVFWQNLVKNHYYYAFVYFVNRYINDIDWRSVFLRTRIHPFINFFTFYKDEVLANHSEAVQMFVDILDEQKEIVIQSMNEEGIALLGDYFTDVLEVLTNKKMRKKKNSHVKWLNLWNRSQVEILAHYYSNQNMYASLGSSLNSPVTKKQTTGSSFGVIAGLVTG